MDIFPFSIRNFNLGNLNDNGNAASVVVVVVV